VNSAPDVSIVIVNYNQYMYTSQCLDSILEKPPGAPIEIIVADNASADGSIDRIEEEYPIVHIVRSPVNVAIAGGNNLGIKAGRGKYVLLLNNDTIVAPGSIDEMRDFLESHPEAAGVGGTLLYPDGTFQGGISDFPTLFHEFLNITRLGLLLRRTYPTYPPPDYPCEVDWLSTAFMMFRRDALEQVGLVDERFFIYSDETDLQYRLHQAGWKMYYLPKTTIIHFGGKSMQPWKSRKLKYRGRLLYFIKHKIILEVLLLRVMFALSSLIKIAFWCILYLLPRYHKQSANELSSHISILKLSITPFC
jgi:N-acetylglucosaminyl-diphospho-decaprenol L-rhamnosyltransferase